MIFFGSLSQKISTHFLFPNYFHFELTSFVSHWRWQIAPGVGWVVKSKQGMYKQIPWQGRSWEDLSPHSGRVPVCCCLGHNLAATGASCPQLCGSSTSLALVQALGSLQGETAMDLNWTDNLLSQKRRAAFFQPSSPASCEAGEEPGQHKGVGKKSNQVQCCLQKGWTATPSVASPRLAS